MKRQMFFKDNVEDKLLSKLELLASSISRYARHEPTGKYTSGLFSIPKSANKERLPKDVIATLGVTFIMREDDIHVSYVSSGSESMPRRFR